MKRRKSLERQCVTFFLRYRDKIGFFLLAQKKHNFFAELFHDGTSVCSRYFDEPCCDVSIEIDFICIIFRYRDSCPPLATILQYNIFNTEKLSFVSGDTMLK